MRVCSKGRFAMGVVLPVLTLVSLVGCSAPPPKDFGNAWTPVYRFQAATTEIPLSPSYMFYAAPVDSTLRTMLKRWASDNGLQLDYQSNSDFTLIQPVANIRATDIQVAAKDLSSMYAPQKITITADNKRILVQKADVAQ